MGTGNERGGDVPYWAELDTPDPQTAARFYGQLLGWQAPGGPDGETGPGPGGTFLLHGRPAAAIRPAPAADRGSWTMYVGVTDAGLIAAKVVAAGGSVVAGPAGHPAGGRSAVLADHSGTRFAVREADAGLPRAEPGTFARGELITDDVEASAAFYGAVFGWQLTRPEGPLGRRGWRFGGRTFSGLLPRPPAMSAGIPPYWDVYFTVIDPADTVRQAGRLGGTTLMPATVTGHGTIAVLTDPLGAVFSVITPAR